MHWWYKKKGLNIQTRVKKQLNHKTQTLTIQLNSVTLMMESCSKRWWHWMDSGNIGEGRLTLVVGIVMNYKSIN